jgi:hypothetical protein
MPDEDSLPIRSYRLYFELERRIHKIDRWRIPVPYGVPLRGLAYGVPLRGLAYGAAALAAVLLASGAPLAGQLLSLPAGVACGPGGRWRRAATAVRPAPRLRFATDPRRGLDP